MKNAVPHTRKPRRTAWALAALALAAAGLTGCNDDHITYVNDGPPAVPTGVYTITGDGRVEVRWNPVYDDDVAGYGVYRSFEADGTYDRLATIEDPEGDTYVDFAVVNGTTYYYAVDAFDHEGHESDLSYELAFDTPRPQGTDLTVFARQVDASRSAIDFSDWNNAGFVTTNVAADADIIFQRVNGLLYALGTTIATVPNDIQDLGYTYTFDDVTWAPELGWSVSPDGVELIEGHTYVVWTHDDHFAKFRVVNLNAAVNPSSALLDWAYQIDPQNPELEALTGREKARAPERRVS